MQKVDDVVYKSKVRTGATIAFASKNRCEDLAETCRQLRRLSPQPEEIIVALDGCTDGSAEMLRKEFPSIRTLAHSTSIGSVGCRDDAFRRVQSEFIVSLDDDSYPMQADFLERVETVFRQHPEAAVVMFAELREGVAPADPKLGPESPGHYVNTYVGCAAAIRRSVYELNATYEPLLWHTYEEPDFAQQCYGAGLAVWFEPSIHVWHNFTPNQRNVWRNHYLNARNEILSVLMRCPAVLLPAVVVYRVVRQAVFAASQGNEWLVKEPLWWWDAVCLCGKAFRRRSPLSLRRYWTWMWLGRHPTSRSDELRTRLGVASGAEAQ